MDSSPKNHHPRVFLYLVRQFFFVYQDKILLLLQQPENHHGDSRALTLSNQTHGFFSLQESRFKWLNWVTVLIKADLSFLQLGLVTKMKKKTQNLSNVVHFNWKKYMDKENLWYSSVKRRSELFSWTTRGSRHLLWIPEYSVKIGSQI